MPSLERVPTDKDCGLVVGDRGTVVLGLGCEIQAIARFVDRPTSDSLYDGVDVIGARGSLMLRGGTNVQLYRRRGHAWAAHDQPELVETPALDARPARAPR